MDCKNSVTFVSSQKNSTVAVLAFPSEILSMAICNWQSGVGVTRVDRLPSPDFQCKAATSQHSVTCWSLEASSHPMRHTPCSFDCGAPKLAAKNGLVNSVDCVSMQPPNPSPTTARTSAVPRFLQRDTTAILDLLLFSLP